MNSHVLKELLKLYPKVKVPVDSLAEFYIDTLSQHKTYDWLKPKIKQLEECYEKNGDITKYKFGVSDKLLSFFKGETEETKFISSTIPNFVSNLNNFVLPAFEYEKKSFADFNDKNIYISIDLSEANYSVFKKYSGLSDWFNESTSTEEYSKKTWHWFLNKFWHVDVALSESKSFRQFVLGNTNPKRLARLQEYEMSLIVDSLRTALVENDIVSKTSDEIIVEIVNDEAGEKINLTLKEENYKKIDDIIYVLERMPTLLPTKRTIYKMNGVRNFGEHVRIKTVYDNSLNESYKELFGVVGTRFFMHFRTLLLQEELHENDLLYMNNNYKSKWLIDIN